MTSEQFPPASQQQPVAQQPPQWGPQPPPWGPQHGQQPPPWGQQPPRPPRRRRSRSMVPVVLASAAAVVVVVGTLLVLRDVVAPGCDALDAAAVEAVIGQPFEEEPPASEAVAEVYEQSRAAGVCRYQYETPDEDTNSRISVNTVVFPMEPHLETVEGFDRMVWRTVDPEDGESVRTVDGLGEAARAIIFAETGSAHLFVKTAHHTVFISAFDVDRDEDWSLPLELELARTVLERID